MSVQQPWFHTGESDSVPTFGVVIDGVVVDDSPRYLLLAMLLMDPSSVRPVTATSNCSTGDITRQRDRRLYPLKER